MHRSNQSLLEAISNQLKHFLKPQKNFIVLLFENKEK